VRRPVTCVCVYESFDVAVVVVVVIDGGHIRFNGVASRLTCHYYYYYYYSVLLAYSWVPAGFFSRGGQIRGLETKVSQRGPRDGTSVEGRSLQNPTTACENNA